MFGPPPHDIVQGENFERLCRLAWREYQAARSFGGTVDGVHDADRPPLWFVVGELGFGAKEMPPTLAMTMTALREWCFGLLDSPRPPTQCAVAAGESLLLLVDEVGRNLRRLLG